MDSSWLYRGLGSSHGERSLSPAFQHQEHTRTDGTLLSNPQLPPPSASTSCAADAGDASDVSSQDMFVSASYSLQGVC